MHEHDEKAQDLTRAILDYAQQRIAMDPPPLDNTRSLAELRASVPATVTEAGIGGAAALELFTEKLATACLSSDHPGYLAFIPAAPSDAATLFDLVVSASSIFGGSWMEGAGAIYAENEVLAWLAREVGLPQTAGGVFVQGGTLGNLSALVAARHWAQQRRTAAGLPLPARWKAVISAESHSSLRSAARVMDIDVIAADAGTDGQLDGPEVARAIDSAGDGVFAVVATAGTTNFGIVDDIASIAPVVKQRDLWLHVDGAYGLAGILSPEARWRYQGVEQADSFIVDPHKWLFAPFDACALVYRDPRIAKAAHTQHAEYLDVLTDSDEWNPSDYAIHLSRRTRGLPLWFSLATYGVHAYREAITHCIQVAHTIADEIRQRPGFHLVRDPQLSVVVFQREGWTMSDYEAWSSQLLAEGTAFVVPSSHAGEPVMRFAVVNPRTSIELLRHLLDSMENYAD